MRKINKIFFFTALVSLCFIGCAKKSISGDVKEFEILEKSEKVLTYSVKGLDDAKFELSCEPADLLKIDGLKIIGAKAGEGILTVKEVSDNVLEKEIFFTVLPYSKEIVSVNGDKIEVPIKPKRVVTIAGTSDLVFLGIKPVAGMNFYSAGKFSEIFKGISELKETQPFDVEEIAKYNPDLIIYNKRMAIENIEKLKDIALVAPYDIEEPDSLKRLEGFCNIFDIDKNEIKQKIDSQEKKIAKIKQRLIDGGFDIANNTISQGSYIPQMNGFMISGYTDFYINVIMFDKLGLTPQKKFGKELLVDYGMGKETEMPPKHAFMGPMEIAVDYIGDCFFLLGMSGAYPEQLHSDPIFSNTKTYKNKKVFPVDMVLLVDKSPLYLEEQANIIVDSLLKE
ncbi:MAG: hypothetical protein CR988_04790 [Treponema sp.]|nr:MAG: hypothetical protein CR988_04790 [Treponema sp.]